jgi:hypothetical protein
VGKSIFYCEIESQDPNRDTWEFAPGIIYAIPDRIEYTIKIYRACSYSTNVWIQGPQGGVKKRKSRFTNMFYYVTKDQEEMKKFMWARLSARSLPNYI